ncbi:MAG: phage portal protein [Planctomycetota bacterium]
MNATIQSELDGLQRETLDYIRSEIQTRAYEAASRRSRMSGWLTPATSANSEARGALHLLRDRSRDLARNDPNIARALNVIRANVVGTGIRAQLDGDTAIEQAWKRWAESTDCDADGRHDLYGLQALVMRSVAESGEALVRLRPRRRSDGLSVPLQLQLLESDHLDTSKDGDTDHRGHRVVQGVEFDAIGRRVAYWIFQEHPGEYGPMRSLQSVRVPAESMLHIFRVDRPGQVRGIPWSAPVMIRARELKDYEDAQLLRQKIAACFVIFRQDQRVELANPDDPPPAEAPERLGRETIQPGIVEDVPAGQEVKFASPPSVGGYDEYVRRHLRAIAVGFGVSYEALTGDYSNVNFSSGRMGHLEFQRNVGAWQGDLVVNQLCRRVWMWFRTAASFVGIDDGGLTPTWILPRREMIDPTREVPATVAKIRGGLTTLSDAIRAEGADPTEVFRKLAEERKILNEMELTTESDPAQAKEWRMPDNAIS